MTKKIVYLDLTTWIGTSFDAEHYYGCLQTNVYGQKDVELEKPATAREAAYLNKKNGYRVRYKKGALISNFETSEEIIQLAIRTYKQHFPEATILIKGAAMISQPQLILDCPDEVFMRDGNHIFHKCEELGWWDGSKQSRDTVDAYCNIWRRGLKKATR